MIGGTAVDKPVPMAPRLQHHCLGARIQAAYRRAGLNRSQFQRALGVAYSTVLLWERDRTQPNADNLRAICEVTGVPVGQLLSNGPSPSQSGGCAGPPAAFHRFLGTPHGRSMSADERRTLAEVEFHGIVPTEETYHLLLAGLRVAGRPED